jgi:Domain of unknown function (DUF4157)
MSVAAPLQTASAKPQPADLSIGSALLQRQCTCGSSKSAPDETRDDDRPRALQKKLTIGASNDPLEQEADRVAEQVLARPTKLPVSSAPLRIQRFAGQTSAQAVAAPASVDRALGSLGGPLEPALRQDMEQRFGHDFSRVRVYSGAEAEQSARKLSANAYTVGYNIVFNAGRFAPATNDGRRLIAHELTHVVQQLGANGIRAGTRNGKADVSHVFAPNQVLMRDASDSSGDEVLDNRSDAEVVREIEARTGQTVSDLTLKYFGPSNVGVRRLEAELYARGDLRVRPDQGRSKEVLIGEVLEPHGVPGRFVSHARVGTQESIRQQQVAGRQALLDSQQQGFGAAFMGARTAEGSASAGIVQPRAGGAYGPARTHPVSPPVAPPSRQFTAEQRAASKRLEGKMAAYKEAAAMAKLAKDAPDLQNEVASNATTMADGRTTLKDLAQENPELLQIMYRKWKQGVSNGEITTQDFGKYVRGRQREFRGRSGELEDAFQRGPKEIIVKAPKENVNEPGTDSISYDTKTDRTKLLDNKSVQGEATVSKVTALERNLPENLGKDIADIKTFAGKPDVPKEIGEKVLPRLEAAKAEIDAYVLKNKLTREELGSPSVQKDFGQILDKHCIDRVVTFGGAGQGARISGKLSGPKGFKTE